MKINDAYVQSLGKVTLLELFIISIGFYLIDLYKVVKKRMSCFDKF